MCISVLFLSHLTKTVVWSIVINLFSRHLSTSVHFYISIFYPESTWPIEPTLSRNVYWKILYKVHVDILFSITIHHRNKRPQMWTFIFQPILISFILYVTYKIVSMLYSNRYCISYRFRDIKGSRWGKLPILGISW
jgi:hypothetical protein